jgi:hypothetical protein
MSISSKVDGGGGSGVIEGSASKTVPVEGKIKNIKFIQSITTRDVVSARKLTYRLENYFIHEQTNREGSEVSKESHLASKDPSWFQAFVPKDFVAKDFVAKDEDGCYLEELDGFIGDVANQWCVGGIWPTEKFLNCTKVDW